MTDETERVEEKDYLTTISIWSNSTKKRLDSQKLIDDESYDHVINRVLDKLSRKHR
jgi:hypothetical protein